MSKFWHTVGTVALVIGLLFIALLIWAHHKALRAFGAKQAQLVVNTLGGSSTPSALVANPALGVQAPPAVQVAAVKQPSNG